MKKLFITCLAAVCSIASVNAQDKYMFNHLSVGITAGTTGLGIDVAAPCTEYLMVRGGVTFVPKVKVNTNLDIKADGANSNIDQANNAIRNVNTLRPDLGLREFPHVPNKLDVQGKVGFTNGKILVDVYPFKHTKVPFFVTVGAYFGTSDIVNVYNREPGALSIVNTANENIDKFNANLATINGITGQNLTQRNNVYAELGDYKLGPDAAGNMNASIKVNGFKPYVGLGFGRAVPKKNRVGCMVELGCQFWGSPKVYCNGTELKADNAGGDAGEIIKTISKVSVYPVLNIRLCGRIF